MSNFYNRSTARMDQSTHCKKLFLVEIWLGLHAGVDMRRVILGLVLILLPLNAVQATETITYTYDAQGRLIKVVHTGTVNNNVTTTYSHNGADNRLNVKTTGAP